MKDKRYDGNKEQSDRERSADEVAQAGGRESGRNRDISPSTGQEDEHQAGQREREDIDQDEKRKRGNVEQDDEDQEDEGNVG